jgi:hypothetical protein
MTITFDESSHTYRINGVLVPNPTRIFEKLGITDFSNIPADTLSAAQHFGTIVHIACELHDKNDLDESTVDPLVKPRLDAWVKFLKENNAKVENIELRVGSERYMFATTLDRTLIINEKRFIAEIKTTAVLNKAVRYQTAAHEIAFKEHLGEKVDGRMAVQLKDDGDYTLEWHKEKSDTGAFLSLLCTYNILTKLGR